MPGKSRKDRLRAATAMFRKLLDEADLQNGLLPANDELLRVFDESYKEAEWARKFMAHLLTDQKTGDSVPFAEIHHLLFAGLLHLKRLLAVLPRGFGKSTICTLIHPLYLVCEKRARYIMLGSFASGTAQKFVRDVREELETNPTIKDVYGDLKPVDGKWTDELFETADDVRVEAIYFGKAAVRGSRKGGVRPDVVILDDLETKEEARNPERVEHVLDWIADEVTKLFYDVSIIVVGTILADGSAIHQLMEESELLSIEEAMGEPVESGRFRLVSVEACDENFENLAWPELFTEEVLRRMAADGQESFDQEMRHKPRSRANQTFHTFHYYVPEDLEGKQLKLYLFLDLIPGIGDTRQRKGDTDYYARVIIGHDRVGKKIYVLEAYHERDLNKAAMVEDALKAYVFWRPKDPSLRLGVEAVAFQVWLADELDEIGREMGLFPPVDPMKAVGNKIDRITSLDHMVNTGVIRFVEHDPHQRTLREELKRIHVKKVHDDLADGLEGCVRQVRDKATGPIEYQSMGRREGADFEKGAW